MPELKRENVLLYNYIIWGVHYLLHNLISLLDPYDRRMFCFAIYINQCINSMNFQSNYNKLKFLVSLLKPGQCALPKIAVIIALKYSLLIWQVATYSRMGLSSHLAYELSSFKSSKLKKKKNNLHPKMFRNSFTHFECKYYQIINLC